ncbi:MAG TPA: hypothetical protein VLK36_00840 [Gaiellaceae bacterium]|nr:hypothetical protein [Gaiellaceae bacterium]
MRPTIRAAVGAAAALTALILAGSAFASYSPRLVASTDVGSTSARIGVVVGANDDPTARIEIFVPAGYQIATASPGTKLGGLTATATAADFGGALLALSGEIDAIAPNAALQAQCGTTDATQTWDLHLTALAQTLDIPLYVVPTSGAETSLGGVKLVACLPPPDLPLGTPGRATFGAKLLSATFDVSAIAEPTAAGDYRWTSRWLPYNPGQGTPNPGGSVETQSIHRIPTRLKLTITKARVKAVKHVRVKGKLRTVTTVRTRVTFLSTATENGKLPATVTVTTTAGGKRVGASTGSFMLKAGQRVNVTAVAILDRQSSVPSAQTVATNDLFYANLASSLCVPSPALGGIPCVGATAAAKTITATTAVTAFKR